MLLRRRSVLLKPSQVATKTTRFANAKFESEFELNRNFRFEFSCICATLSRVSTHPARLGLELTPRQWKRLRRDSGTQAAA